MVVTLLLFAFFSPPSMINNEKKERRQHKFIYFRNNSLFFSRSDFVCISMRRQKKNREREKMNDGENDFDYFPMGSICRRNVLPFFIRIFNRPSNRFSFAHYFRCKTKLVLIILLSFSPITAVQKSNI